ncbi:GTP-binding protein [Pseudonocardia sp. MCCB 268]|nr:GTP-binding protein [Pseudonocardia cytotoxica]
MLSGFLGAGKTTLLDQSAGQPGGAGGRRRRQRHERVNITPPVAGQGTLHRTEERLVELDHRQTCCIAARDPLATVGELAARGSLRPLPSS